MIIVVERARKEYIDHAVRPFAVAGLGGQRRRAGREDEKINLIADPGQGSIE